MDASLDLKDSRAPTFISFEQEEADKSVTKPATKRKRTAKNDTTPKPQKKKALKSVKKGKIDRVLMVTCRGCMMLNYQTLNFMI